MSALTQDKQIQTRPGIETPLPVKASKVLYGGAFVCSDATGFAVPGEDAAGLVFKGYAVDRADNSTGDNGDVEVVLHRRGQVKAALGHDITQANVGDAVFLVDDQTVDLTANVTHKIYCGVIDEYIDSRHAWIDIEPAIQQTDVAAHIADASAAHAAGAISIADEGAHFAAAEATVEAALAKLAKTVLLSASAATIATDAADAKIIENMEFPVPVRIKRAYATLGTAPGADKTLTIEVKVGDGADAALCTVEGTATTGAAEALDIAVAANTAFDIQLTQDSGSAAGLNLVIVAAIDDGE